MCILNNTSCKKEFAGKIVLALLAMLAFLDFP